MTERAVTGESQAALLDSQRQVLERIANGAPLSECLDTLVRLIEERAHGIRCAVLLTDSSGERLGFIAAPHIPDDYKAAVEPCLQIGPGARSRGTAVLLREPVYCSDTRTDPRWKSCSQVALRNGFVSIWSTPIMADDDSLLGIIAMCHDKPGLPSPEHGRLMDMAVQMARVAIDAQKRDESLRGVELRLRQVIDTIPAAVWSAAPDGSVDFVNQRWLDFLGMSRGAFDQRGWKDVVHPDDVERCEKWWQEVVASGAPFEIEHRVRSAGGDYRWTLAKGMPMRDAAGRIVKWYGTAMDIEDRKRVEVALRRSEDHLRHVIDAVPAIVWSALADGSIDFVNDRWMAYTGLRFDDALDKGWKASIHPDDLDRTIGYWRSILASGEPGEIEQRIRGAGGEYRWFLTRFVPLRDTAGAITRWFGTCTDIEERRVAAETLRRNQAYFVSEARRIARSIGGAAQSPAIGKLRAGEHVAGRVPAAGDEAFLAERHAVASLSANERAIIRLIAAGKSNAQIGKSLDLSRRTIETYRGRLMQKLQIDDVAALVKLAIRQGLTSIE
jgi:PAS domain S-box-containing protein